MDVGDLLAREAPRASGASEGRPSSRQHSTRHSLPSQTMQYQDRMYDGAADAPTSTYTEPPRPSRAKQQKHVTFELLLPEGQDREHRARLPMRVMISPHDTTDSIITTVRNFYGLYEGPGVSFQDKEGRILIATFENFEHNMVVYVRMTAPDPAVAAAASQARSATTSPRKPKLAAPIDMRPPSRNSRPTSRAAGGRSLSPQSNRSHRSTSKPQSRSGFRPKEKESLYDDMYAGDTDYDSDGAHSRRSKIEPHASAEISVENIVEGGRRKRAKFDSSELPLFVPPQVPAANSISSVSPQRRPAPNGDIVASPFSWPNGRNITYQQPLPSPQSYNGGYYSTPYNTTFRGRAVPTFGPRSSVGGGAILPTPEPTNASVISDEDVALQLMRLGDASNFSSHGRTSTSTMDDGLSGKADAASSVDEDSDLVDEEATRLRQPTSHAAGPRRKKQRVLDETLQSTDSIHSSADDYSEADSDVPEYDENGVHIARAMSKAKGMPNGKPRGSVSSINGSVKSAKSRVPSGQVKSKPKSNTSSTSTKVPISPASLPSQSRKTSAASTINFQHQLGIDEEDLSTKPRCQRCRKSKKGCDRQRPCGRCKDAGIGIEGCVSEDEGNGRKGRYGRHMGVPVKKSDLGYDEYDSIPLTAAGGAGEFLAPALPDKNKKRKR
ncbi:hypothetical protein AUEXF2481DRAFT_29116 [Aureobasidium subglaciale EXF-2481]|uniref:Zn(2)-C6 fungal-type domain-containing protein n=1 Tax=Aureobasidium subglaciale (strain EXF-2481) TaxID=1043005 RepID=A0A074YD25_AURSE|nr:uncharacterized protein AUEXF2481DRAFT_29116 [Aureobasidium subglaciale EXF-2481]KAI5199337.1 hypothetical protein E4T38_07061 [Aureobasidium subglaciale]KAI5218209.1 hypothetical protein E4T40_06992 [Aureobasidium subglaciale]KAI5221742.1 hypothetical protein E4T41_06912 [Aureobasidium subglaciale]KAI5259163.1 hypothetical protein E4T46_06890 [Aureobasidium subglaciale]KEQ95688.1 hypothetical protein AUEXF2481DRAFT_29116 [Aureobasidium subglaciale EXF-2481]